MRDNKVWVGLLVLGGLLLFGGGLFLIGDQHKAFSRNTIFYAEFASLSGIAEGAKVRVSGMDGGQVESIEIPPSPSKKFRVKLTVEDSLCGLIRIDSIASVETAGIVGDTFLAIKSGGDQSPRAQAGATILSKEPFDLAKMLDRANGVVDQVSRTLTHVNGTITDLRGRMDGTLDSVTATVHNTNGIVLDIRHGKGAVGVLLEDPKMAGDVRETIGNTKQATANLNSATAQVDAILQDVQQRQMVAKIDDTLSSAKSATQQLDDVTHQLNSTMKSALAPDQFGLDAGTNLQQALSNINTATDNLADDTEAIKHEFFFKGFFNKRGYDNLDQIPVLEYRRGDLFKKLAQDRQWVTAEDLFVRQSDGIEVLTTSGRSRIDQAVKLIPNVYDSPLIIEGYAKAPTQGEQLIISRQRAILIRVYIQLHYHLAAKQLGVVGLGTQPSTTEKSYWDGICIVKLSPRQ